MEDIVSKKIEKNKKKVFTKKRISNTIRKKYNPLSKDCYCYKRGGRYMEKEILKEIKKDLNFKEKIIVHINKKTFIKVFNKTRLDIINKVIK